MTGRAPVQITDTGAFPFTGGCPPLPGHGHSEAGCVSGCSHQVGPLPSMGPWPGPVNPSNHEVRVLMAEDFPQDGHRPREDIGSNSYQPSIRIAYRERGAESIPRRDPHRSRFVRALPEFVQVVDLPE